VKGNVGDSLVKRLIKKLPSSRLSHSPIRTSQSPSPLQSPLQSPSPSPKSSPLYHTPQLSSESNLSSSSELETVTLSDNNDSNASDVSNAPHTAIKSAWQDQNNVDLQQSSISNGNIIATNNNNKFRKFSRIWKRRIPLTNTQEGKVHRSCTIKI